MTLLIFAAILSPVVLTSFAIFVAVTAVAWVAISRVSGGDKPLAETRLDMMRSSRGRTTQAPAVTKKEKVSAALEKATMPMADNIVGNEKEMSKLRERLMNAGFRGEKTPVLFKGIQVIMGGVGLLLGGVTGLVTSGFSQGLLIQSLLGLVIGYMGPSFILSYLVGRRKEKVFLGLPDALDMMVVCVEAGLGMDQALRKVAEEMEKSHKEIGEEFGIANQQLQFGRTRTEVLQGLGLRSGVDDLKQLASILIQADKFGSSIATALRVQSDAMRVKRRQLAEEKAAKTAVKMIFPLVLFIFPGIFVVLVGPAAISMYRNLLSV